MKKTVLTIAFVLFASAAIFQSCKRELKVTGPATVVQDVFNVDYNNNDNTLLAAQKATVDNDYAALGRVLFYDTRLSFNGTTSCATCHKQALGFADDKPLSTGFSQLQTGFNSMSIANIANNGMFFWRMRANTLEDLSLMPVSNHREMGFDHLGAMVQRLNAIPFYNENFKKVTGNDGVSEKEIRVALSNFINSVQGFNSKYDKSFQSNETLPFAGFSAIENKGKDLFFGKYNCASCHAGATNISNNRWFGSSAANIGLDPTGFKSGDSTDFKAPTLRNIGLTAPYMHDGRFKNLSQVLDHYSTGVKYNPNLSWMFRDFNPKTGESTTNAKGFNISEDEKSAIIAFLGTLTDENLMRDHRFSNPFQP
jgi:cytochrome c peroxidase